MCVCQRERKKERESESERERERKREKEKEREREKFGFGGTGSGWRCLIPTPLTPRYGASACATVLPPSGFGLWVFVVSGACRGTRV